MESPSSVIAARVHRRCTIAFALTICKPYSAGDARSNVVASSGCLRPRPIALPYASFNVQVSKKRSCRTWAEQAASCSTSDREKWLSHNELTGCAVHPFNVNSNIATNRDDARNQTPRV